MATLRAKHAALAPVFTERSRRVWAATEARALGHGGIAAVERATGISRATIKRGLRELDEPAPLPPERTRRLGGGRKRATAVDQTLLQDLDALVEPTAPGDPDSPLRWSSKSVRTLAVALQALGHHVSHTVVAELLHQLGYSLQGNVKTREGRQHPDRDAQFRYIAALVTRSQRRKQPTISVDTKKKELIGDFKNGGRAWRPKGAPDRVRVHDFVIPGPGHGKAIPYGVYDLHRDEGWVSVGIDHDTASFAVNAIRRWWQRMGRSAYSQARSLLITADAGGSNGTRLRLWKWELQRFANRTGLTITVCHFPPGTSKWNRIEHRLFSHIAMNWRGTPLVNLATIVNLIGSTHSRSGLRVRSEIDRGRYPGGLPSLTRRWQPCGSHDIAFTASGTTQSVLPPRADIEPNHHYDERISPERYLDLEDVIVRGVEMVLPIAKLKDPDRVDEPEIGAKGIWIFDNNWARPRDLAQAD